MHDSPDQTPSCRTPGCRSRQETGYAPRGLCTGCEMAGEAAIEALPSDWADLQPWLWQEKGRSGDLAAVGGVFGPTLPFDAGVDALARELAYTAVLWEIPVRERARLSDAPRQHEQPRGDDLVRASRILAAHFSVLIALPPVDHVGYDRQVATADGPDAVVALTALHRRVQARVGSTSREYALPDASCSACNFPQLRHRDGRDEVYCPNCRAWWTWDAYQETVETALFGAVA